jgi:uncharacterized DUF497 family protein
MAKPVFAWSAIKRLAVLQERGLDFIDGQLLFDGRPLYTAPSRRGAEMRWLSIGELNGRLCAVVWTVRNDAIRIITMRRARHGEEARYRTLFG